MCIRDSNFAGAIAVPVLLATLAMAATALGDYGDRRAREAVVDKRLDGIETYARDHTLSAKRIEDTVVQMRVDQAQFVGSVNARVSTLESNR